MYIAKENNYVRDSSGQEYCLSKKLGEGGEGAIYKIQGHPDLLAKIYKKTKRDKISEYRELENKIKGFEKFYNAFFQLCPNVCWVQHAIYYKNEFQGYISHYAHGTTLSTWLADRVAKNNFDDTDIIKVAIEIAQTLEKLHNLKSKKTNYPILIGDLQPQNILISSNLDVSIIDSDSFQIGDALCQVQFPTYVSPERLINSEQHRPPRKRTPDEENYVMAYLFFQMMMYGTVHPYNHFNNPDSHEECVKKGYFPYVQDGGQKVKSAFFERWNQFSPKVREGFKISFHDSHPTRNPSGQVRRYTPEQWIVAFQESLGQKSTSTPSVSKTSTSKPSTPKPATPIHTPQTKPTTQPYRPAYPQPNPTSNPQSNQPSKQKPDFLPIWLILGIIIGIIVVIISRQ